MSVAAPIAEFKTEKPLSPQPQLMPQPNRLNGAPDWFQQRSAAAWDDFQSLPLPSLKDEAWRYSSAKKLGLETLQVAPKTNEAEKLQALARSKGLAENAAKLVFVNDQ